MSYKLSDVSDERPANTLEGRDARKFIPKSKLSSFVRLAKSVALMPVINVEQRPRCCSCDPDEGNMGVGSHVSADILPCAFLAQPRLPLQKFMSRSARLRQKVQGGSDASCVFADMPRDCSEIRGSKMPAGSVENWLSSKFTDVSDERPANAPAGRLARELDDKSSHVSAVR